MKKDIMINELPLPTWRWLRMNGAEINDLSELHNGEIRTDIPAGIEINEVKRSEWVNIKTALGNDMDYLIDRAMDKSILLRAKGGEVGPASIDIEYVSSSNQANSFALEADEGAEMTVIMRFAEEGGEGTAAVQTKYMARRNAKIRLIQVQHIEDEFRFLNDIGGECEEGAEFELVQLILGAGESYIGSRTELNGKKATQKADIAYLAMNDEKLDMNYIVNHIGEKTACEINADGVLRGRAKKLFRGTIDFKKGCAGSVGNEREDILLMDDGVVNRTIPVILCTEEEVEGNHGASIGKIDEETLFYLTSRGMPEKDVMEMMARARIDKVKNKIRDEATRDFVDKYME